VFLAHSIRLRDPWQCEPLEGGGLRWTRVFHRPTGLEPDDSLCLVICDLPAETQVTVNGHAFKNEGQSPTQLDVTPILAADNRIEILVPPQASSLKPQASSFPYDARLAVLGRS
jgi:hypothetical protein